MQDLIGMVRAYAWASMTLRAALIAAIVSVGMLADVGVSVSVQIGVENGK